MRSLWLDDVPDLGSDPLDVEETYDAVVVGAGLTGLTTALLLARAGRRVAVVEARHVGAATTGHTTAKVSLLQGTRCSRLLRRNSHDVAAAYVEANRDGQAWLLRFCADHDVPTQTRDAVTYAASPAELRSVRDEHEAAASLGLPVTWADSLDVPFPLAGATVLPEQAQFDPMDVLRALVSQLREHGGVLHQGVRVKDVSQTRPMRAVLEDGREVTASTIVLATGMPILDRGLYFAKVQPNRSYAAVFRGVTPPQAMYLSAGTPVHSIRDVILPTGPVLMVGGYGHVVGRTRSEQAEVDRLRAWTLKHFPGAVETHAWSAQDYTSPDGLPYVGKLPRGGGAIYLATGYDKWGMANAVAAARRISGEILGEPPSWAEPIRHRITRPGSAAQLLRFNLGTGMAAACGLPKGLTGGAPRCTHQGGTLHWNDAEDTWDCPLHGSRFDADGGVLEGPATQPLKPPVKKPTRE